MSFVVSSWLLVFFVFQLWRSGTQIDPWQPEAIQATTALQ